MAETLWDTSNEQRDASACIRRHHAFALAPVDMSNEHVCRPKLAPASGGQGTRD